MSFLRCGTLHLHVGVIEELMVMCRAGLVAVRNGELGQKRKDETWQERSDLANG